MLQDDHFKIGLRPLGQSRRARRLDRDEAPVTEENATSGWQSSRLQSTCSSSNSDCHRSLEASNQCNNGNIPELVQNLQCHAGDGQMNTEPEDIPRPLRRTTKIVFHTHKSNYGCTSCRNKRTNSSVDEIRDRDSDNHMATSIASGSDRKDRPLE